MNEAQHTKATPRRRAVPRRLPGQLRLFIEPAPPPVTFPEELKRLLEELGISRTAFAKSVGVSSTTVLRWSTGTAKPTPEVLKKLASLGLRHARPEWTNQDGVPRNKLTTLRHALGLFQPPGEDRAPGDDLRDAVRGTLRIGRSCVAFAPAPYVYNGPPNQLAFFEALYTLQEAGAKRWKRDLGEFVRRLSCVKGASLQDGYVSSTQAQLEQREPTAAHWDPNYGSHGWHRYVGRFPPHLVRAILNAFAAGPEDVVCDPFLGSGTTAVECRLLGIPVVGSDICPLSTLISSVKSSFPADPSLLVRLAQRFSEAYEAKELAAKHRLSGRFTLEDVLGLPGCGLIPFPNIEKWFTPEALLGVSLVISIADSIPPGFERDALLVALSARMRSIGNVDVDVVRAEYNRKPREKVDVRRLIARTLVSYAADVRRMLDTHRGLVNGPPQVQIQTIDVRKAQWPRNSISHVITSPPYGVEAISYLRTHLLSYRALAPFLKTDPYKFEADIIGSEYIDSGATLTPVQIRELDSPTGRSFFGRQLSAGLPEHLAARAAGMVKFFVDMAGVVEHLSVWVRVGGRVAFVIGNKRLGDAVVPANEILRELFGLQGFCHDQTIQHKLKCNNSNSQVPWQERTIQEEYVMLFTKE